MRLGIVSFAGTAAVVQTPTESRDDMLAAIDRFQLQRATATGSGLLLSLSMLFPDEAFDLEAALFDPRFSAGPRPAPLDQRKSQDAAKAGAAPKEPMKPGSYTGGVVILLSDGRRTTGPDPLDIAKMAADRGVRVYTVGFGTREGASIDFEGYSFYVRLDEETLKGIAKMTGGEYFHAGTAADLRKVYETLNAQLALERQQTEIGALFVGVAAALRCWGRCCRCCGSITYRHRVEDCFALIRLGPDRVPARRARRPNLSDYADVTAASAGTRDASRRELVVIRSPPSFFDELLQASRVGWRMQLVGVVKVTVDIAPDGAAVRHRRQTYRRPDVPRPPRLDPTRPLAQAGLAVAAPVQLGRSVQPQIQKVRRHVGGRWPLAAVSATTRAMP